MNQGDRTERIASEVLGRLEGCPEADRLRAFGEGALEASLASPIREHLSACRPCAVALAVLDESELSAAGEARQPRQVPSHVVAGTDRLIDGLAGEPEPAGATPASSGLLKAAAAAALLISLGLASYLWLGGGPPGEGLGELRSTGALEILEPEGEMDAAPAAFRWNPHPLASSYRVLIFDEEMNQVWSGATAGSEPELPFDPDVSRLAAEGGWLIWQVVALDEIDGEMSRSPAAQFRVTGARP